MVNCLVIYQCLCNSNIFWNFSRKFGIQIQTPGDSRIWSARRACITSEDSSEKTINLSSIQRLSGARTSGHIISEFREFNEDSTKISLQIVSVTDDSVEPRAFECSKTPRAIFQKF